MKVWDSETEERVAPRLRRAVWSADEAGGEPRTMILPASAPAVAARPVAAPPAGPGIDWYDEWEGPVRGKLRRALQAID
ncbi:MAG TPA: hypothetical protein VII06_36215 [Chloroflexota bacterium]|jgi:hypothetical protein